MLVSSILALYGNITANRLAAKISSDAIENLRNDSYEIEKFMRKVRRVLEYVDNCEKERKSLNEFLTSEGDLNNKPEKYIEVENG
jgi:hypothetical protein